MKLLGDWNPSSEHASRPVRRTTFRRSLLLALLALLAAGCGSASSTSPPRVGLHGPFGKGADQVWIFEPQGRPKSVVVFIHGLGRNELDPREPRAVARAPRRARERRALPALRAAARRPRRRAPRPRGSSDRPPAPARGPAPAGRDRL